MKAALHDELIKALEDRFAKNMRRHPGIDWSSVQAKLEASPDKLEALSEMERTGAREGSYCWYCCRPGRGEGGVATASSHGRLKG